MSIFISYARRDNDIHSLQSIENLMASRGHPYVDDFHYHRYGTDRHEAVEAALRAASAFVAVVSPHYLRTPWTRKEFTMACDQGIPMSALLPDGTFVDIRSQENPQPERARAGCG